MTLLKGTGTLKCIIFIQKKKQSKCLERIKMKINNIKLNKKEIDFLYDWLSDDLDIQLKESSMPKRVENILRSIVKKLEKKLK